MNYETFTVIIADALGNESVYSSRDCNPLIIIRHFVHVILYPCKFEYLLNTAFTVHQPSLFLFFWLIPGEGRMA